MEEMPGFPTPIGVLRSWNDVARYEDIVEQPDERRLEAVASSLDRNGLPPRAPWAVVFG